MVKSHLFHERDAIAAEHLEIRASNPTSKPSIADLFIKHVAAQIGPLRLVANSVKLRKLRSVRVLEIVLE
jgi:hypothetical protein